MMIFIFQPSVGCGSNTSSVFYAFQCDSDLSCVCAIQLSIKYLDTGQLVISTLKVFSMLIRIRSTKVQVRKYFGVSCYSHFQPPGQQLPSSIIAPYINAHAMEDREKRTLRLTLPSWSCLMLKEDSLPRRSSSCSFLLLATFVAIAPSSHNPLGHQGARTEKMERKHGVCVWGGVLLFFVSLPQLFSSGRRLQLQLSLYHSAQFWLSSCIVFRLGNIQGKYGKRTASSLVF